MQASAGGPKAPPHGLPLDPHGRGGVTPSPHSKPFYKSPQRQNLSIWATALVKDWMFPFVLLLTSKSQLFTLKGYLSQFGSSSSQEFREWTMGAYEQFKSVLVRQREVWGF